MITTSQDLLTLSIAALTVTNATTTAQARVFAPGDWPTQPDQYPILKLRLTAEDRQSLGRGGAPEFTTTTTIRIMGEVSEPASVDNGGASLAEASLWQLKRQVEVAIINSYPLTSLLQHFPSIRSQLAYNSDGPTHLAGIQIDIQMEFYEGPESFAPVDATDLDEISLTATNYPPAGFAADLQN
jgi:hypothetical protein